MPSLAKQFSKEQIEHALEYIINNNVTLKPSTVHNLVYKGKTFPPKEVVRWAARLAKLPNWENMTLSGGDNTNLPLKALGFTIVAKNDDFFTSLIAEYKNRLKNVGLKDELYKWKLVKNFKGRPDINAIDFAKEVKGINFSNLVYGIGIGAIKHLAESMSTEYKKCFEFLFDENFPLAERIKGFMSQVTALYRTLVPAENLSSHHDERTIATLLTYHNPEKYTFYKDSFYRVLCERLDIKPAAKGEKYSHYLSILEEFISDYIQQDQELITLVNKQKDDSCYEDPSFNLLGQDILYTVLEKQNMTFSSMVEEIKAMLTDSEPANFKIITKKIEKGKEAEWIKLGDSKNIIRGSVAHYEISRDKKTNLICVALHFEEKSNNQRFKEVIGNDLLPELYWDDWYKGYSIFYKHRLSLDTNNLASEVLGYVEAIDKEYGDIVRQVIESNFEVKEYVKSKLMNSVKYPKNQILYGPPGTGKTYHTINKALAIIENKTEEEINLEQRKELNKRFNEYIADGQIVFTTFHQSMAYEDFIEGIKPLKPQPEDSYTKYDIESGIFKRICQSALTPNFQKFNSAYNLLVEELSEVESLELKTPRGKEFAVSLNSNGNLNLHTGKERTKQGVLTKENIERQINSEDKFLGWEGYFAGVITYLKNKYSYAQNGVAKNFVLIIDEINRGNVSQIFGELITCIEDSKRLGSDEAIEVVLPYSKNKFGVPNNVYLIGTMNTADRSVEALDTALRRRFSFVEMLPKPSLVSPEKMIWDLWWKYESVDWDEVEFAEHERSLHHLLGENDLIVLPNNEKDHIWDEIKINGIDEHVFDDFKFNLNLKDLLERINLRLEKLLSRDHTIGHAFFLGIKNEDDLYSAFFNKIIPLLQEYFFGDYGKIGLVLGSDFVKEIGLDDRKLFADFKYDDEDLLLEKKVYRINDFKSGDVLFMNAVKAIYANA
nr:AAA family ATPase [uncultured Pedobacter sp.]